MPQQTQANAPEEGEKDPRGPHLIDEGLQAAGGGEAGGGEEPVTESPGQPAGVDGDGISQSSLDDGEGGFADGDDIAALGVGHDVATNHLNGIVEMGEEMGFDGKDVGVVFG